LRRVVENFRLLVVKSEARFRRKLFSPELLNSYPM
jgi:hypothetical protein